MRRIIFFFGPDQISFFFLFFSSQHTHRTHHTVIRYSISFQHCFFPLVLTRISFLLLHFIFIRVRSKPETIQKLRRIKPCEQTSYFFYMALRSPLWTQQRVLTRTKQARHSLLTLASPHRQNKKKIKKNKRDEITRKRRAFQNINIKIKIISNNKQEQRATTNRRSQKYVLHKCGHAPHANS